MDTDRRVFERIFSDCYDDVVRYCLRRASREDALDAAAETFLVAWRRRTDVPVGRELAWLYAVAFRVLANQRRAHGRQLAALAHLRVISNQVVEEPEPVVVRHHAAAALVDAMARLSAMDQELIRLAGWEELDRDELAIAVGCTPNAATKRLNRALDRLGRELGVTDRAPGRFFRRRKVAS